MTVNAWRQTHHREIIMSLGTDTENSNVQIETETDGTTETGGQDVSEKTEVGQNQEQAQEAKADEQSVPQTRQSKVKNSDRIAELENKIAKIEAAQSLVGLDVVDSEVVTDLLLKGYSIQQLQKSKPYLFKSKPQEAVKEVKQPQKIVSTTVPPKPAESKTDKSSFVEALVKRFTNPF